jgi:hypothetical protein
VPIWHLKTPASTPKALANCSPGFERRENPGDNRRQGLQTLKGFRAKQTLSGLKAIFCFVIPGFLLRSNPGLKLANAFGVNCAIQGTSKSSLCVCFEIN